MLKMQDWHESHPFWMWRKQMPVISSGKSPERSKRDLQDGKHNLATEPKYIHDHGPPTPKGKNKHGQNRPGSNPSLPDHHVRVHVPHMETKVLEPGHQEAIAEREASNQVMSVINNQLNHDRVLSSKKRYEKKALQDDRSNTASPGSGSRLAAGF